MSRDPKNQARFLTALLAGAGVLHLVRPEPFDGLIPSQLPGTARAWTLGSGVAELAVAGLLANPATRSVGGRAAEALFVGVFPGNLKMAWDWRGESPAKRAIALGRLPLQLDLVARARTVARG
ncbi:putative membrane protein [Luteococcus japonicus]|uniref:Putative membrane protein n=2 Tax=Luteococcus japonicus TaxID=33984 RepID=A0A1R4IF04_9ACTN|nr:MULTISPECIES: hypothetical protein [Luteococcus]MDN5564617.1 hypothetical protein [Luteococcus sp.]ROR54298.1 putative membrane protein [Luteococcus japonicus]SJN17893.1 putative membrane protein [Luteococcus japonicus LSP_Lj1]